MPEPREPLPSLEKLQRDIDEAKTNLRGEAHDAPASSGMGDAMRMGVELVAGVAVGSTVGYFMDRWLHTMPLFFVICFFLGAAAGFRNMLRDNERKGE